MQNQTVGVRISIIDGSANGEVHYQETFTQTTNQFGLVNLEIGNGTPVFGTLAGIDWGTNSKFIETEIDPAGGTAYVSMGTSELLSIPYALYSGQSKDAVWNKSGDDTYYNGGNVGIGTPDPANALHIAGDMRLDESSPYIYFYNGTSQLAFMGFWTPTSDLNIINKTESGSVKFGTNSYERMRIDENGNVGIGTTTPYYQLHIEVPDGGDGVKCDNGKSEGYLSRGYTGVEGRSVSGNGGTGVYGNGGQSGVAGSNYLVTSSDKFGVKGHSIDGTGASYGVYGYAGSTQGTLYGVYGKAATNAPGYGVYFSGGLGGTGTKNAIVKTEDGPKLVYCQESPESWFEDFGSSIIKNGKARVSVAEDFHQTVTISSKHPYKVFITPNARIGDWWVEKEDNYFILYAPEAEDGAAFDYRLVAKRKGFEDQRLVPFDGAYTDTYLYPTVDEVPEKHKQAWLNKNRNSEDLPK